MPSTVTGPSASAAHDRFPLGKPQSTWYMPNPALSTRITSKTGSTAQSVLTASDAAR